MAQDGTLADLINVLIESDWNLKTDIYGLSASTLASINRIRLEFKDVWDFQSAYLISSINRIRLEFKACFSPLNCFCTTVLIESDWNLKLIT